MQILPTAMMSCVAYPAPVPVVFTSVFNPDGTMLPVGHTNYLDYTGRVFHMHWMPVPNVYSPPVGVYGVRLMVLDIGDPTILPSMIGFKGRHFKAITESSEGVMYIFVRPGTTLVEIWGTFPPGMDDAKNKLIRRMHFLKNKKE